MNVYVSNARFGQSSEGLFCISGSPEHHERYILSGNTWWENKMSEMSPFLFRTAYNPPCLNNQEFYVVYCVIN